MGRTVVLALVCCGLLGCSIIRDRRDAAWDPRQGQAALIDQIPNWDGEAGAVCGGHLREEERKKTGRSSRC